MTSNESAPEIPPPPPRRRDRLEALRRMHRAEQFAVQARAETAAIVRVLSAAHRNRHSPTAVLLRDRFLRKRR